MFWPSQSPLLTKQAVEVSSRGELVTLRIGNVDLPMHYEHALDIHRWIRQEARTAKCLTGRVRTVRSLGTMHDASAPPPRPLPYTAGVAIHVKPQLRAWRREDVWTVGRIVYVKIGNSTINFHYETALKIAQWLRVRAKEAKGKAGDVRHWSEVGAEEI